MTISTVDQLNNAPKQKLSIAKGAISNTYNGASVSYWRAGGSNQSGGVPGAASVCDYTTPGGVPYTLPPAGQTMSLSRMSFACGTQTTMEVHDRLAHMGGLNATLTTAQTVGIDLNAMGSQSNIAQRKGRADYSSVQWWLECYTVAGSTAVTMNVNYTDQNGNAKVTTAGFPTTWRPGVLFSIVPLPGDFIRSIESVTLVNSSGTAGNFGITATVQRAELALPNVNMSTIAEWAQTGMPPILDQSCLVFIATTNGTTLQYLNGLLTLAQG